MLLRQSTAATITIGPCLGPDGAEYDDLVISDLTLTKDGVSAAMAAAATLTSTGNGHYSLGMIAGNTNTLGRLQIHCNEVGYQIPVIVATVLTAETYDAIHASAGQAGGYSLHDNVLAIQSVLAGITSLAQWLGLIAGKQTPNNTALTEIRATGAGSGTYTPSDDSLEAQTDNGQIIGPGSNLITVTVNDTSDDPLENVDVWVTTDEAGTNVIAGTLKTNASGQVSFMLDAGTYYIWRQLGGYNFTNPQEYEVE